MNKKTPGINAIFALLTLVIPALFWRNEILTFSLLMVVGVVTLTYERSKKSVLFYSLIAIIGPLAELIGILSGAWSYSVTSFFPFPIWLPLVWGQAGIFIKTIYEELGRHGAR